MSKRMLIDASHREETRVVVLDGQKVEEFDFESATKRPLKGNIYLAKVTRVEPSLQAAFVEYGGNRQGFLAFSEIHPDYYQIPVADRQALLAEQEAEARRHAAEDFEAVETATTGSRTDDTVSDNGSSGDEEQDRQAGDDHGDNGHYEDNGHHDDNGGDYRSGSSGEFAEESGSQSTSDGESAEQEADEHHSDQTDTHSIAHIAEEESAEGIVDQQSAAEGAFESESQSEHNGETSLESQNGEQHPQAADQEGRPAQALHSARPSQRWTRRKHYKIQEVIKRRQVILVQVVKEERGNKGAALTTYMSLPGRYCVLMPNTPRGGGISRKITDANDRKRLKSAAASLELPEGMGVIIRTAGENRTKVEIKRDYEYLLRLWDQIRELTLKSNAPACVYEEGDLIKRAIRDLYNKDVSEVIVEGDEGYRNAKDFMRMLMPSHAKNVKPYKEQTPLFQSEHIEAQLDAMFQSTVTLKSGGYIVIDQTEALVSIDVNSGRATREHSIEDTATKTNLEAADEIGRQLRLRDLAGLIVIDFIDMEDSRNDRAVEKRIGLAVKNDRARVQVGKISQFGLLEMSRQRLRAGVVAGSTVPCPHCNGQGIIRSVESTALRLLRSVEEEGQKRVSASISVKAPSQIALYTLNQKRRELARIEGEYEMSVTFEPDETAPAGTFKIEQTSTRSPEDRVRAIAPPQHVVEPIAEREVEVEETDSDEKSGEAHDASQETSVNGEGGARRKRRRRGGRGRATSARDAARAEDHSAEHRTAENHIDDRHTDETQAPSPEARNDSDATQDRSEQNGDTASSNGALGENGEPRRKRRRRRGRRGRRDGDLQSATNGAAGEPNGEAHDDPHEDHAGSSPSAAIPNSESEPVWSLTPDSDSRPEISRRAESPRPQVEDVGHADVAVLEQLPAALPVTAPPVLQEEIRPQRTTTPAAPVAETSTSAEPSGPPRKGWWQRKLKPGN